MMTDNEIIKALELCGSEYECHNGCPYYNNGQFKCRDLSIYRDAFDLINRQKAEIDDLRRDDLPRCKGALRRANEICMALEQENQELKAEVERLTDKLDEVIAGQETLQKHIEIAKAKAVNAFLRRALDFVIENVPVSLFKLEYGKDVELFSDVIRVKDLVRLYSEVERECSQIK